MDTCLRNAIIRGLVVPSKWYRVKVIRIATYNFFIKNFVFVKNLFL